MNQIIRVGLVEDQLLFREGIKAILNYWSDIDVMFESSDGHSVLSKLQQCSELPDVLLVDLFLPRSEGKEFSGLDVTQTVLKHFPDIKIVILSVNDDENFMAQVIELGAHAYLIKDCDPEEVHDAIVSVHKKGSYINERALRAIQNKMGKKLKPRKIDIEITKREEEILILVCQQLTTEEIAEKLFISVKTVNGHRNNLLQKTGSRNVTGLVLYAVKNQLIEML